MTIPASRHVVIVGGGHAHVHVLRALAECPEAGARLTVISPTAAATYTGMVPGVMAGQYRLADAQIDVAALAARAGARFVQDRVSHIDPDTRRLQLAHHDPVAYDLLSLDIGAQPATGDISADAPVVFVKPIEVAIDRLETLLTGAPGSPARHVVIIGAGAGGVELSFALRTRLRAERGARVTVCDTAPQPVAERGARAARLVAAALAAREVTFLGGVEARRIDAHGVQLADGRRLAADLVVWSTGAAAPALFAASTLAVDAKGFLRVDATLRCVTHPNILAAGDCIALDGHPQLPKAGVYAVRQGPVLATNLSLLLRGVRRLQLYQPQRLFLSLLSTCDGAAILSYGRWATHATWAWRLKDHIDRRFVARYRTLAHQEGGEA